MTWNVYRENFNDKCIEIWNVFKHHSFTLFVEKALKLYKTNKIDYQEFDKRIKTEAQYYFWSKSEHEVVITSWPPYVDKVELQRLASEIAKEPTKYHYNIEPTVAEKVDIYDQLNLNWDAFVNYIITFGDQPAKELELAR